MSNLISVIATIYNTSKYLEVFLDSVVAQSYKQIEIILVDDGSVDESGMICDRYAASDNRIKVIHQSNQGAVRARINGFDLSRGKYVLIVDSDDWLERDMIEVMYKNLVSDDCDVAVCGRIEENGDFSKDISQPFDEGRYDKTRLINEIYPCMIAGEDFFEWGLSPAFWDKLIKREYLEQRLRKVNDNLPMGQDAACIYPCILDVESIYITKRCLYHYRQVPTSMVRKRYNYDEARYKFGLLYNSVKTELDKLSYIYDCQEQWLRYVLFLMIPRSDMLYRDLDKQDHLFPFPKVKKGKHIIIYSMGLYGQRLYHYLAKTGFCQVVAAIDSNYDKLIHTGINIEGPEAIDKYDYDAIVIAASFAGARESIYNYLTERYPSEKIHKMDEDLIMSKETLMAFGLEK